MKRIREKIEDIERFLAELKQIAPKTLQEYQNSLEKKAACERYIEKIIEAILDLSFLVIKLHHWRTPKDENDAFLLLHQKEVIDQELVAKLKAAKGMRNILVHQYGNIDDAILFQALTKELTIDSSAFIKAAKQTLDKKP